jgi:outer membrane protein
MSITTMKTIFPYSGIAALLIGSFQMLGAQGLRLSEAVNAGLAKRQELQSGKLQTELAATQNDRLRADWLPHLTANGDMRYNPQLATSVIPVGQFGFPGLPADQVAQVQFGTSFNNSFSIQAEQRILAPGSRTDKEINDLRTQTQALSVEQQQVQARQLITEAYFGVLYQQERLRIAQQAGTRAAVRLADLGVQLNAGAAIPDDLARAELEQANADLAIRKASQDLALAQARLRHEARLDAEAPTRLLDSLSVLQAEALGQTLGNNASNRPEIRQANLRMQTQVLSERRELARRLPVVSAYGAYGYQQLSNDFNPFAKDTWFPNSYIGIRASVTLFDGHKARLNSRDFSYQRRIDSLEVARLREGFAYEVESANTALSQAVTDMETASDNLALARRLYDTDNFRLQQGRLTASELKNTEYALQSAEHNVLSAVYNFLLASLNYRKATGNL